MSEDFLYIFVNLNVFNEVKYNKEQKIKKENYNQKIITKEKRLKNKKQNIIKIEEGNILENENIYKRFTVQDLI